MSYNMKTTTGKTLFAVVKAETPHVGDELSFVSPKGNDFIVTVERVVRHLVPDYHGVEVWNESDLQECICPVTVYVR